jgi:hypothetical protein
MGCGTDVLGEGMIIMSCVWERVGVIGPVPPVTYDGDACPRVDRGVKGDVNRWTWQKHGGMGLRQGT